MERHKCQDCGCHFAAKFGRYGTGWYANLFYCWDCWHDCMTNIGADIRAEAKAGGIEYVPWGAHVNPFWCTHCSISLNLDALEQHLHCPHHKHQVARAFSTSETNASTEKAKEKLDSKRKTDSLADNAPKKLKGSISQALSSASSSAGPATTKVETSQGPQTPAMVPGVLQCSCAPPVANAAPSSSKTDHLMEAYWEFKASDQSSADSWQPLQAKASREIEQAYAAIQGKNPQDGDGKLILSTNGFSYSIDFGSMTQKNVKTGRCRPIRRVLRPSEQAVQRLAEREKHDKEKDEMLTKAQASLSKAQLDLTAKNVFIQQKNNQCQELAKKVETQMSTIQDMVKQLAELRERDAERQREHDTQTKLNADLRSENAKQEQELEQLAQADWNILQERLQQEESWRLQSQIGLGHMLALNNQTLLKHVESLLQGTSHSGKTSRCDPMSRAKVVKIEKVHNVRLWDMYRCKREQLRNELRDEGVLAKSLSPAVHERSSQFFRQAFPSLMLDDELNEVLLFHGTSSKNMDEIVSVGFDERLSGKSGRYGEGVYFADASCKSFQYGGGSQIDRCICLARVLVGDPFYAKGPMQNTKIPPYRDVNNPKRGRHNSVVVNVGTPTTPPPLPWPAIALAALQKVQEHREFVIFDGKLAYPEYIIHYTV